MDNFNDSIFWTESKDVLTNDGILHDVTDENLQLLKENPEKFWEGVVKIGRFAFWRCKSLDSIVIPPTVKQIGEGAFNKCSSLTSITIPNSVTKIGSRAFEDCSSLQSITIPDSVEKLGTFQFQGCSSLKEVTLPKRFETDDKTKRFNMLSWLGINLDVKISFGGKEEKQPAPKDLPHTPTPRERV